MTAFDDGFICGVGACLAVTALGWLGLWIAKSEAKVLIPPPNDDPFSPLADLRLLHICEGCRRFQDTDRTIQRGQHVNIVHVRCPRCAKRAAALAQKSAHA